MYIALRTNLSSYPVHDAVVVVASVVSVHVFSISVVVAVADANASAAADAELRSIAGGSQKEVSFFRCRRHRVCCQAANHSVNQPHSRSVGRSVRQHVRQAVSHSINQPSNQPTNQPTEFNYSSFYLNEIKLSTCLLYASSCLFVSLSPFVFPLDFRSELDQSARRASSQSIRQSVNR